MSLEPLFAEGIIVTSHALAAVLALLLGAFQLTAPKGTLPHRALGLVWAALMMVIAVGSMWISELPVWGRWSPIHLLSLLVIVTVPLAVWRARRGEIAAHSRGMKSLYLLALIGAGSFTLWPGRVLHGILFGA